MTIDYSKPIQTVNGEPVTFLFESPVPLFIPSVPSGKYRFLVQYRQSVPLR